MSSSVPSRRSLDNPSSGTPSKRRKISTLHFVDEPIALTPESLDALNAAIHDDLREPFGKIIKKGSCVMGLAFSAILNAIVDRCNTMNHLGLARIDKESIQVSQADDIGVLIRRAYRKRKYEDIMRLGAFSPCFSSWLLL